MRVLLRFCLAPILLGISCWSLASKSVCTVTVNRDSQGNVIEEPVYTYLTDQCNSKDYPDIPARAYLSADNKTVLLDGNSNGFFPWSGTTLDSVTREKDNAGQCVKINFASNPNRNSYKLPLPNNPNHYVPPAPPRVFYNNVWFNSPWIAGNYIYAIVHNEFRAWQNMEGWYSKYCSSKNSIKCWYPNSIAAVSTDNGASFTRVLRDSDGSQQLVIASPYHYTPNAGLPTFHQGIVHTTNIIKNPNDKNYYVLALSSVNSDGQNNGFCLYQNKDVSDLSQWRGWDGSNFTIDSTANPYRDNITDPTKHTCTPLPSLSSNGFINITAWSYNTILKTYIAVGNMPNYKDSSGNTSNAFVYVTSSDMIHWSTPTLLFKIVGLSAWKASAIGSNVVGRSYISILENQPVADGPDTSNEGVKNFMYTGKSPYLYFTRFNAKTSNNKGLDRDLVRVKLTVSCQ